MTVAASIRQLGLFSAEDEPLPDPDARLVEIASGLPGTLRLGTSSWTFEGWRNLVYHRRYRNRAAFVQESLVEYARHPLFRTVGLDRSYYAPVTRDDLLRYRSQTPDGFRFVSKAFQKYTACFLSPREGSGQGQGNPHFLEPEGFLAEVVEPMKAALGERAGPFLLQFSPFPQELSPKAFENRLASFLKCCAGRATLAVELREARFLTERYFHVLHHFGAAHCFNHWTHMPALEVQRQAHAARGAEDGSPVMVIRLLLPQGVSYRDAKAAYAPFDRICEERPAMRAQAVRLVEYGLLLGKEVFLLVNNKAEGSSPLTVRALAEQLQLPLKTS